MVKYISFVGVLLLCWLFPAVQVVGQVAAKTNIESLKGKKVLVVYGGWKGHKPKEFSDKVVGWLKQSGAVVTVSDSLGVYANKTVMDQTDLIVQSWTMGVIKKIHLKGLLAAVKRGVGFAGCHGGIGDSFRNEPDYQYMVGGQWIAHPGGQVDYTVQIANEADEVTRGVNEFGIKSEQYYMLIDPNTKVLATTKFSGEHNDWINGSVMPVVWKRYFAKGRVFYSSLGHNTKDLDVPDAWTLLSRGIVWAANSKYEPYNNLVRPIYSALTAQNTWTDLFDDELTNWDTFMGAPHTTTNIEGYEKFDDVTKGTPIGLNKDPNHVFTIEKQNGEPVLRVSGEIFAGLVTKNEYENYHLKWEFKWGDKKWAPRLNHKRNSGVLYHSVGDFTDFWNVWMTCLECEVQETDCGDFITLGAVKAKAWATKKGKKFYFDPKGKLVDFSWGNDCESGRCFKPGDPENKHGQWNTMELICVGNTSVHILNGNVVMVVVDPLVKQNGVWVPMNKGKIQLQSEAAEIYYKNMKIRSIAKIPDDLY